MRILIALLLAAAGGASAQTLPADDDVAGAAPVASPYSRAEQAVPAQLTARERFLYRRIFLDLDNGRARAARAALAAMPRGLLHPVAEAEILLADGVSAGLIPLTQWLAANGDAPQAPAIVALARRAGAADLPQPLSTQRLLPVRLTPAQAPRSARGQSAADADYTARAAALIAAGRPGEVEALADAAGSGLAADVRSEWLQRAAWNAYIALDDATAGRLGTAAARGTGDWAALGSWVAGLAAFRRGEWDEAAARFDAVDHQYTTPDIRAAGAFWAARAHVRAGRPQLASARLGAAMARDRDGFYGLLAARTLGLTPAFDWREPDFIQADWTTLKALPGARRATALVEVGQLGRADRELRHLAATSGPDRYEPILRLAARLNLPATQYWLANHPPAGRMPEMASRLPTPDWRPFNGWRVDRNLVFAHAMQESQFITTARSGPGAKGLMQLMPGTARDLARAAAMDHRDDLLADPAFSVEYGQSYLEQLRDSTHTGGLLPKVVAAYNAGPGAVKTWNAGGLKDNGDVLLFMESIPFRETRHYVEVVLRNYWLYGLKEAAAAPAAAPAADAPAAIAALDSIAANRWPRFPASAAARSAGRPSR